VGVVVVVVVVGEGYTSCLALVVVVVVVVVVMEGGLHITSGWVVSILTVTWQPGSVFFFR
jgi:hypothetical protein